MTNTFPLPIECLQLIIGSIAVNKELSTLASLLRVSKHVCEVTLPFIYKNPFVWFDYSPYLVSPLDNSGARDRGYHLVPLFLRFVPQGTCTGLVKAAYDTPELAPPQAWGINYLAYVRAFHSLSANLSTLLFPISYFNPKPSLKQYMIENELLRKYSDIAIDYHRSPDLGDNVDDPLVDFDLRDLLLEELHTETTWVLCGPILEQLQGIVIPVSDIDRYFDEVHRLSSLQSVTFQLDGYSGWFHGDVSELTEEGLHRLGRRKVKRVKDLETAVKFIQTHAATFRGTLKQVFIPELRTFSELGGPYESSGGIINGQHWFERCPWSCPETLRDQMLACLPSLIHPTELTDVNWKQFVAKSEATDVTRVTTINMTKPTGRWYGQLKSRPSFLHRCRSLREYNMVSFGPESFKFVSRKDVSHVAHPSSQAPEALLPFLEHVSIHAFNKWFGTELDDIGRSCGTKIRYFKIWGHYGRPTAGSTVPFVEIGSGWNMPRLSKLFYILDEIDVCQPGILPQLTMLQLCGTAALSFHPDTLHSTKELQILVLGMPEGTPIPSVQSIHSSGTPWPELVHSDYEDTSGAMFSHPRPQWTWDWHLPNLDTLDLSVGFALHFQFRMLQRCPNLCELFLSIFSEEGRVKRVLTEQDFVIIPAAEATVPKAVEAVLGDEKASQEQECDLYNLAPNALAWIFCHMEIKAAEIFNGPRFRELLPGREYSIPPLPPKVMRQRERNWNDS
ncbi:hypothetical protein MVEG_01715 [Podila verticillata NRRL 6337]|nr:hypothetical protein MVEG_01715 [Podila verticillata NRRL 6337]